MPALVFDATGFVAIVEVEKNKTRSCSVRLERFVIEGNALFDVFSAASHLARAIFIHIYSGVVGRGRGGRRPPLFSTGGTRLPLPSLFWTEIRAKVSPLLQLVTY